MEIDITDLVNSDIDLKNISGSRAELGQDAGKITWNNALNRTEFHYLKTPEAIDTGRDWIKQFGAWKQEEIDAWTYTEINALLLQFIVSELREYLEAKRRCISQAEFRRWEENCGGSIYCDVCQDTGSETEMNRYFFYMQR